MHWLLGDSYSATVTFNNLIILFFYGRENKRGIGNATTLKDKGGKRRDDGVGGTELSKGCVKKNQDVMWLFHNLGHSFFFFFFNSIWHSPISKL